MPVQDVVLTSSSETSLIFTWVPPITAVYNNITGYNLTCIPLLKNIPARDTLELGPNISTANVTGLYSGVAYNCSIVSLIASKSSEPYTLTSITMEIGIIICIYLELSSLTLLLMCISFCNLYDNFIAIAPTGHPLMFAADAGQRKVNFTWQPPSATQRNGVIPLPRCSCSQ